jgi:hypothetical protein
MNGKYNENYLINPSEKHFLVHIFHKISSFNPHIIQVCCGFQISLLQKLFSIKYFRNRLLSFWRIFKIKKRKGLPKANPLRSSQTNNHEVKLAQKGMFV